MFIYYKCITIEYMIVIDSSTLILLAKTELLDNVIQSINSVLTIPDKVFVETTIKQNLFDAKLIYERVRQKKIRKIQITDYKLCSKIEADLNLGAGEAEAIVLCFERKGTLVCDDKKAINACKLFNIKFTTAPNLLVALYKKKLLSRDFAVTAAKKLILNGRYSEEIVKKLLEELK